MPRSLLFNLTGHDRPGVTAALFKALPSSTQVLDVEQVVVDGLLTLAVLLEPAPDADIDALAELVTQAVSPLGIQLTFVQAEGGATPTPSQLLTVTVIGSPLTGAALSQLAERVAQTGANIDRIERIAAYPVTALELSVSGAEVSALRKELASLSHDAGIDIAVQSGGLARRGRHLVVMDVDSTVIQDEVVELLAAKAGVLESVKAITDAAMRGELDFEASLRERVALLAGLPSSVFDEAFAELTLTPGARTLCRVLRSMDYQVALVSGGFSQVVEPLAEELGVDFWEANLLEVEDGLLTGRILGEVVDRPGKARALARFAEASGIGLHRTIAIGDGANDLDMLQLAALGIAFNAKSVVQASADAALNVPYLDSVLYFLGITREEVEQLNALG